MSPSKIYKVGFSTNGSSVLYVKEVFLSMDGVTPALGIEELNIEKTEKPDRGIFNLQGQRINSLQKGINIVDGKKIMVRWF